MSHPHSKLTRARKWGSLALAGALSVGLIACSDTATPTDGATSNDGSLAGETIAFIGYGDTNPWGAHFNSVYVPALEAEGATVMNLATMDAGTQVQNFNQAVAQNPSVIVTILVDTQAMVAPMRKAIDAGIQVVVVDGPPDTSLADDPGLRMVLSDNVKLGELAATNIIEGIKAQGRDEGNVIVISGTQAMLLTQERMSGFNSVFDDNPEFTIVEVQDGNWDPTLSGTLAQQLLAKYGPDGVQGAYGMADYMAVPIINAAKQLGFAVGGNDGLIVSGGNCFKAGIDSIRAGELYGTATQDPGAIAEKTVEYTIDLLTGKNPPRTVTMHEDRVTADNLDEFAERCSQV